MNGASHLNGIFFLIYYSAGGGGGGGGGWGEYSTQWTIRIGSALCREDCRLDNIKNSPLKVSRTDTSKRSFRLRILRGYASEKLLRDAVLFLKVCERDIIYHRRYLEGVPCLSKMVYKRVKVRIYGRCLPKMI